MNRALWMTITIACLTAPAYADPYLYGGLGSSFGNLTDKPGLWRQEGLPYTTDLSDLAYKGGLGVRFESGVFVEAGLVDPGSFLIRSQFVTDAHYNPDAMRCEKDCHKLNDLTLNNAMRGGELVVGYQHTFLDVFQPYGKVGVAGFAHEHSGTYTPYKGKPVAFDPEQNMGQNFSGMILAVAYGGGLCAPAAKVQLCGDATYYHPIAHTANPLVESFVITTAQVKVPLVW